MHGDKSPVVDMVGSQSFEMGSQRATGLAPRTPEVEDDASAFSREDLIERVKTFDLVNDHD